MSSLRLVGGTLGAALLLVGWGIWVETSLPTAHVETFSTLETAAVSAPLAGAAVDRRDGEGRQLDRYGNEVERAVSDYRIDYRGDVYERHSPQTAMPALAPPIG